MPGRLFYHQSFYKGKPVLIGELIEIFPAMIGEQDAKRTMRLQVIVDNFYQFFEGKKGAVFGYLFPVIGRKEIGFEEGWVGNNKIVFLRKLKGAGIALEYGQALLPVVLAGVFL